MGAHLIFFIIFTLFSCIILTNRRLPWYSLRSGFQCDTKMAAVFSCMRPSICKALCINYVKKTKFEKDKTV